jgi:hypothetical protein
MKPIVSIAIAAAASLAIAGSAFAAPPKSIGGSTWTMQINRESAQLVITNQGGSGAPGASVCRVVIGTFGGIAPARGWYCPSTGRIHLLHHNAGTGAVVRSFTGNVSDDVSGQPLYMAGTVAIENAAFGDLGERNFSATRP